MGFFDKPGPVSDEAVEAVWCAPANANTGEPSNGRTELQMAMEMHQVQFDRANRMQAECDDALAEVERLRNRLIGRAIDTALRVSAARAAGYADGVAAVKAAAEVVVARSSVAGQLAHSITIIDDLRTALAAVEGGESL